MPDKIFDLLLRDGISVDSLCDWLQNSHYSQGFQLSNNITISKDEFGIIFLDEIRRRTKWLLKESNELETPLKTKHNATETRTPQNNSSIESTDKINSSEKKSRPRVKLFTSPRQEHQSSSLSKTSTPIIASSSPLLTPNRPIAPIGSPIWNISPDVPSSGSKGKSWNGGNDLFENTKHRNKSLNDDGRGRSKCKLMLGDFIKESGAVKTKGRRIKPTKVSSEAVRALPVDGVFANAPFQTPERTGQENLVDRASLKMECDSVVMKMNEINLSGASNCSQPSPGSPSTEHSASLESYKSLEQTESTPNKKRPIKSDPNLVTNQSILHSLATIYASCIHSNLCENIMIEFCYLMNLVTADEFDEHAVKLHPFESIHNCHYFAVDALQHIERILMLLAATTLSLLAATPTLIILAPEFQKRLEDASRLKLKKSSAIFLVPQDGNVHFQQDTDNIENFTSQFNFSTFRKQRDGLYVLLQTWEKSHNLAGWDFQEKLGGKVRSLLLLKDDPTNLMHLARLFRNQLLASCSIQSQSLEKAEEEVLELLPRADRGRLSLLQARLSRPGRRGGPVPPAQDFSGRQVFFQQFIRACHSGTFLHFLQLSFVDELLRLNDMEFVAEGNDNFVDELTQKRFIDCVSSAQILAKFLAYVEFLPYQNNYDVTEQVLDLHNAMRMRILPLFNVEESVTNAIQSHRLIVTIPWLVAYLSLMDRGSARLPAYMGVWRHLQALRLNIPHDVTSEARLLIQLCLGWLFQIAAVPEISGTEVAERCGESGLDELPIVTESVLYHVCPYLSELNSVLSGNSSSTGRHIRPTPTTPKEDKTLAAKQLELRLEENFLQNQSQSTRRTIQFVCERVSSCAIKEIAATVLPKIKEDIKLKYSQLITKDKSSITVMLGEWEDAVSSSGAECGRETVRDRVQQSMRALLGRDVADAAANVAIDLTIRQAMEKVHGWIQSFALADSVKKELVAYLEEEPKGGEEIVVVDLAQGTSDNFDGEHSLAVAIATVRQSVLTALQGDLTQDQLTHTTNVTRIAVQAKPLPVPTERILFCLLVELLIWSYTLCEATELACRDLAFQFKAIFHIQHMSTPLNRLFCSRNLEMLKNKMEIVRLTKLPLLLVDAELISREDASSQVSHYLKNAPEVLRKNLHETLEILNNT